MEYDRMHARKQIYTHTHFVKLPKFVMQKMINVQHVSIDMNIWKSIEVWWSFLISFSFSYQANNNNNRKTSSKLHNNREMTCYTFFFFPIFSTKSVHSYSIVWIYHLKSGFGVIERWLKPGRSKSSWKSRKSFSK